MTHHTKTPNITDTINLTRRSFLVRASAGAALTMGYGLVSSTSAGAGQDGVISPNMHFYIHTDGRVVVHIAKAEMGQHVGTALAQILAEELECGWANIELVYMDFDPRFVLHLTGGSWLINWSYDALSRAGATGRIALIEMAAAALGGDPSDYSVTNGVISGNGGTITYGELASKGTATRMFSEDDMKAIMLKSPNQRNLVGTSVEALDIPIKTRGEANYGIDVVLDNMIYATPATPPVRYGAKVLSVNDSAAKAIPGYLRHVVIEDPLGTQTGFVMAVADSYWTATKAAQALEIDYDTGPNVNVTLQDIHTESRRLIETEEAVRLFVNDGDTGSALGNADETIEAEYTTVLNIHAPLEPMNATVEIIDDVYHIYAGNQFQTLVMGLVGALGVKPENIRFHQQYLGGGFGRRLDADYIVMACLTARVVGKPVKMIYSRETDTMFDFTRPAAVVKMTAGLKGGQIDAWKSSSASAWASARQAPAFLAKDLTGDEEKKLDAFAVNGADHWYTIPNQKVLLSLNTLAQAATPSGHLRSVGPGWQFWAGESFVDEIAAKLGIDPLELRLKLLDGTGKNAGSGPTENGALRLATVLKNVAGRAGYGNTQPNGTAMGLVCVSSQERNSATWTACAANVSVNVKDGTFKVNKLTLAMVLGTAINPNGVRAQIEGSAMWGLSIALLEECAFENGAIQPDNFDSYFPARMNDLPELDIELIPTKYYPTGCGEPATTVVAPAIANAIFRASGARVRSLPITPEKVLKALAI
ncbi:MAG: molybdopterin-dependent oxidoreductase [Rhizobiaceae bacterium]